jgi:hypothetical protein
MRRDRRERPRRGGREPDNRERGRRRRARTRDACRVSLTDPWLAVPGAGARGPGLPRQRPSAGAGPRRAQRAALIIIKGNFGNASRQWR